MLTVPGSRQQRHGAPHPGRHRHQDTAASPSRRWRPSAYDVMGRRRLSPFGNRGGESTAAWRQCIEDLARGLRQPDLVIIDGSPDLEVALTALWGEDRPMQHCMVHNTATCWFMLPSACMRNSAPEEDGGGQEDGRTEEVGAAVVAGCNGPPALLSGKEILDFMTLALYSLTVMDWFLAAATGWNAKCDALLGQHLTDFVPVIPLIPHHRCRRRQVLSTISAR